MRDRLSRLWRLFGTALSFGVFGLGGLLLGLLVFPSLRLVVVQRARRTRLARRVIGASFRFFVRLMALLGILRYEVRGLALLKGRGQLILANHPSLIDTVFLMALVDQADCIVKDALWRNPFTGGVVRSAGYINNQDGAALIDDCIAALSAGSNLIIFPEGTRTPLDGSIKLKRGAANVAVRGRCDLTPVLIRCSASNLGKGQRWWRVPLRPVSYLIEVQPEIKIAPFLAGAENEVMAARHLTTYLQDYFMKKDRDHAAA